MDWLTIYFAIFTAINEVLVTACVIYMIFYNSASKKRAWVWLKWGGIVAAVTLFIPLLGRILRIW